MTKFAAALAACAAIATTAPAFAETKAVTYADLNLATVEGQEALERRVTRALEEVCQANEVRTGTRMRSSDARRCMREAKVNAKKQVAAILERHNLGG